jgi:hypothetical protein
MTHPFRKGQAAEDVALYFDESMGEPDAAGRRAYVFGGVAVRGDSLGIEGQGRDFLRTHGLANRKGAALTGSQVLDVAAFLSQSGVMPVVAHFLARETDIDAIKTSLDTFNNSEQMLLAPEMKLKAPTYLWTRAVSTWVPLVPFGLIGYGWRMKSLSIFIDKYLAPESYLHRFCESALRTWTDPHRLSLEVGKEDDYGARLLQAGLADMATSPAVHLVARGPLHKLADFVCAIARRRLTGRDADACAAWHVLECRFNKSGGNWYPLVMDYDLTSTLREFVMPRPPRRF